MMGQRNSNHVPLASADPMSSGNPYASQSPRGFEQPQKKSRKKMWIIIGVIVALLVIIGAVLGGVLGSRSSSDSSSGGSKSAADNASGNGNAGAPSGVSNVNSEALTATNENRYLAIATDSEWMLPVYPTGVSPSFHYTVKAHVRLELLDSPHLPLQDQATRGPQTTSPLALPTSDLTPDSVLPNTSGTPSTAV
jgi:hypothetical protein